MGSNPSRRIPHRRREHPLGDCGLSLPRPSTLSLATSSRTLRDAWLARMGSYFVPNYVYPKGRLLGRFPLELSGKGGPLSPVFAMISTGADGELTIDVECQRPFPPEKRRSSPFLPGSLRFPASQPGSVERHCLSPMVRAGEFDATPGRASVKESSRTKEGKALILFR